MTGRLTKTRTAPAHVFKAPLTPPHIEGALIMSSTYLDDLNRATRAFLRAQATDAHRERGRRGQAALNARAYTPPTLTPLQRLAAQVLNGPAPYELPDDLPDTLPTPPTPPTPSQDAHTMTPNNTPTTTPNKPGRRPTYSPEQKARALQLHSEGVDVLAIAAQLNIGKTTIYSWITEQRDPNAPKRIRTTTPRTSQPATAPTAPTAPTALERRDAIDAQIKAREAEREALRGAREAEREARTAQLNRLTQALSK